MSYIRPMFSQRSKECKHSWVHIRLRQHVLFFLDPENHQSPLKTHIFSDFSDFCHDSFKDQRVLRSGCPPTWPKISWPQRRRTSKADSTKLWEFRQIVVRLFSALETAASGTMWCPCGAHVVPMWCSPSGPSDVHWIHWPLVDKWKILPWTMSIFLPETQLGTWSGKSNGERPPKFDGRIEKRSEIPWSARESTASAEACYTPLAWQNWKMMMTRTKNAGPFVCAPRWQQVASDFLVTLRCHAWGVIDGVGIDVDSLRALKKAGRRQFQWLKVKDDDSMVFKLLTHLNSLNYGQSFLVSYGTFNFQYSFCIVLLVKNRSSVFGLSPPFLCFTSWSVAGWV